MKCKNCQKEIIRKSNRQKLCFNCEKEYRKEYDRKYKAKYYQLHKIEIAKKKKEFYQLHQDKLKKFYKDKYLRYKEHIKIYQQEHKQEIKNYQKNYILTSTSIYSTLLNRNKKLKREFITKNDFINWYNQQEQKCYYCGRSLKEIKQDQKETNNHKNRLSIDRKNNNRGYTLDNIVLACYRCNLIKGNYFTEREMLNIGKILYKGVKNER